MSTYIYIHICTQIPIFDSSSHAIAIESLSAPGALDRFCQFFRTPLFSESATEREINAVDSEHSMNIQADSRRSYAAPCRKITSGSIWNHEKPWGNSWEIMGM